jgi:AraC-like DNA-binding protein
VLPDGCVDLVWDGTGLSVVTTGDGPVRWRLPATAWTTGLRLRCGAAGHVLGVPVAELPSRAPLTVLWGDAARRAEDALASGGGRRVLESLVATRLPGGCVPGGIVAAVRCVSRSAGRVGRVADDLGISERTLRRRLCDEVGLGPKQLHRVLRFRRFLRRVPMLAVGQASLAAVAAELGYADQSHLGRECRRLADASPAAVIRSWARQDTVAEKFQTPPGGRPMLGR